MNLNRMFVLYSFIAHTDLKIIHRIKAMLQFNGVNVKRSHYIQKKNIIITLLLFRKLYILK